MTYWTCIGVETSIPWPSEEKKIQIENHQLILRPESDVLTPSIAFEHGSKWISPKLGSKLGSGMRFENWGQKLGSKLGSGMRFAI